MKLLSSVSDILKNVKGLFAGKYNKLRGTTCAVWRPSFSAEPVRSADALRRRAGLAVLPADYAWSSARWNADAVPNLIVDALPGRGQSKWK